MPTGWYQTLKSRNRSWEAKTTRLSGEVICPGRHVQATQDGALFLEGTLEQGECLPRQDVT